MRGRPFVVVSSLFVVLVVVLAVTMRGSASAPGAVSFTAQDSDNDGLPDDWENGPGRAYGCDPRHADLLVYSVERTTHTASVDALIARATTFFADLNVTNPDGRRGIHLHVIRGPVITRQDDYTALRAIYQPAPLNGRVHFWLFGDGNGGGQTCGTCGISTSGVDAGGWQAFAHEMGHQLGLEHEALGFSIQSPLHASLMNYAYNYTFDGSGDAVHYSDGRFASLRMRETNLDETLPFPIASLHFLAQDPYRFALKAMGSKTQVDWNRNGVFGETGVKADINYAEGTTLGERMNIEVATTAPVAAYRGSDLYVAYGVPAGAGRDLVHGAGTTSDPPTPLAPSRTIVLRKSLGKDRWGARIETGLEHPIGDPSFVVQHGVLWVAAQSAGGIHIAGLRPSGDGARPESDLVSVIPNHPRQQPTLAVLDDRLYLFLHEAGTDRITSLVRSETNNVWSAEADTGLRSKGSPGVTWDSATRKARIVVTTGDRIPFQLVVHSRGLINGRLDPTGESEPIGGADGSHGLGRPAVLLDTTRDAGPAGRLYVYHSTGQNTPVLISMQVADRSFHGGWLDRSAYDEWTVPKRVPTAAMGPSGGIAYVYREEPTGMLKCSFGGSGVQEAEMGDFDEVTYIRDHGLRDSLVRLGGG